MLKSIGLGIAPAMLLGWASSAIAAEPPGAASATPSASAPAPNLSTPGSGELTLTNPQALACEDAAKVGDLKGDGIDQCTQALRTPLLSQHDLAATYTDRGAVYLQHRQWTSAKADFESALKLDPTIADTYVDLGAALLAMKEYAQAITDIDHGLALGPDQPEKAYFNRAIADGHLNDDNAAYQDFLKASQLNPNWPAPRQALAAFGR